MRFWPRSAEAPPAAPQRPFFFLGEHTGLAQLHDGQAIYVDTRDVSITPHILRHGCWETWVESAFVAALRPGMTVLDVGANMGYFTLIAARLIGLSGHIHAVEANPRMASLLRRSLSVNGHRADAATLHACAAHSEDGEVNLNFSIELVGGGSVARRLIDADWGYENVSVPARRLDGLLPKGIAIDVLKIDIEGDEYHAFKGMGTMLDGRNPMQIICEFRASAVAAFQRPRDYLEGFAARGFTLHVVEPAGVTPAMTADALLARVGEPLTNLLFRRGT